MIGITATTENRFLSFQLADIAKKAHPEAFCCVRRSAFHRHSLRHLEPPSGNGGVVSGEGELTLLTLVQTLQAGDSLQKVDS